MAYRLLIRVQIILAAVSVLALALYAAVAAEASPLFWAFVVAFALFMSWDITMHVRALRRESSPDSSRFR